MARPRPSTVDVPTAPKGFVASAVNLPTMDRNVAGTTQGWQRQAWAYWETVGELRYPTQWIGNVMSRATLHAAHIEGAELVVKTDGPGREAMDALFGGLQGHADMLKSFGVHLSVAGEGYLVYIDRGEQWYVVASGKARQTGTKGSTDRPILVDLGLASGPVELGPNDFCIRIWTGHPRNPVQADSPTRANLTALGQICGYDAHIQAQLDSRLAGAGILLLPSELDFQIPEDAPPGTSQASAFMSVLGLAMMTPIKDRSNASALVPIVAMAPGEHLDKAQHLKFWSDLDANVVQMRDAAIKRLALGIDVPPEILLGVADASHWNAWLSEESAIKAHLEPRLGVVTHGLTTGYLRPAIRDEVPDPDNWFVVADTAPIRLRPNRSTEALELHNRGELSGDALRRETGFLPTDAPQAQEVIQWLLRRVATGASSPEQSLAALAQLGVDLGAVATDETNTPPPDNIRIDTGPRRRSARDRGPSLPPKPELVAAGSRDDPLIAASEVLVYRALERAGNRLRNTHRLTDTTAMPAHAVYQHHSGDADHLLDGSWDCAIDVLRDYTDDPANVVDVLDFYVRGLLGSKRPPSRTVLSTLIATRPTPLEAAPS